MLLVSAAFTRFVKTGARWSLVAGLALLVAGCVSDALLVAATSVSMSVVTGWAWRSSADVARRLRWLAPTTVVTAIVAGQCTRWLVAFPQQAHQTLRLHALPQTLTHMLHDFMGWPRATELLAVFTLAMAFVTAWRARRSVFTVWLLAGFGMLAGVVATANVTNVDWQRYVLWLPLAALFTAAALLLRWRHGARVLTVVSLAVVLLCVRPLAWVAPWRTPTSWWRGAVECVERLAAREQANVVITDYWHAKPLVFFSTKGLRAAPVQANAAELSRWIVSDAWYGPPTQTALVVANGLDAAPLGPPSEVVACGALEVRVFRGEARARLQAHYERWLRDAGLLSE